MVGSSGKRPTVHGAGPKRVDALRLDSISNQAWQTDASESRRYSKVRGAVMSSSRLESHRSGIGQARSVLKGAGPGDERFGKCNAIEWSLPHIMPVGWVLGQLPSPGESRNAK